MRRGGVVPAFAALAVALSAQAVGGATTRSGPIRTDAGLVAGTVSGLGCDAIRVYRGIPYAAPPVGPLRWKPPQPVMPWRGVRQAVAYAPTAAQYYRAERRKVPFGEAGMSEDSLYLNVNAPLASGRDKLPVLVEFHGGGLDAGTADDDTLNAAALPRHGIITVSVNHRLGVFGLLATPELTQESPHAASGNYGMLDLVTALQWVKRNIAAFGGDPDRVTLYGAGGGGQKVIWLLASPMAKGLFRQAIVEAGTARDINDNNTRTDTQAESDVLGEAFLRRVGTRNVTALRAMPWQRLVDAMPPPPRDGDPRGAKDGRLHTTIDAWSLDDNPINTIDENLGSDVPVLIGARASDGDILAGYAEEWLPAFVNRRSNVFLYRLDATSCAGLLACAVTAGVAGDPVSDLSLRILANFVGSGDPSVRRAIDWPPFAAVAGRDRFAVIAPKPAVESGFIARYTAHP